MAGFFLPDFAGMMPRVSARLLEPNRAQDAINAELFSGELKAFRDLATIVTPTKVGTKQSIYRFGQDVANEALYWFHWLVDVDVARGPVNNDAAERTYWTGETEPRVTDNSIALTGGTDYPMAWYKLGVPKPVNAPNVAINGVGTGEPRARAYVYTYVSVWGEEGPPSNPSAVIEVKDGQTVDLSNMSTGPGAGYNIVAKRIYRALSGSTATDYQFVAEIAVALTTYNDAIADELLGEVIRSTTWIPPETGLKGLVVVANSFFAGFLNNDVWLSEPYLPHAWPVRYRKSTPFGIVSLGSFDRTLVALTKGEPYAGAAADPSGLVLNKIAGGKACVSKRGTVSLPGGVAYPCADGLALVSAAGWQLATEQYFTRKQWQALVPSTFLGARWGQRYVGFYNDGAVQRGFIFDPTDARAGLIYIDVNATAAYNDPQRDALYLQVGADIKKWDAAGARAYTWRSKIFVMPRPINPRFMQVRAATYPVTVKLYADAVLKHTAAVASSEPFSLPSGYKAREFEIQAEGTVDVKSVAVAESMQELKELVS